jgi:hypothetical protein
MSVASVVDPIAGQRAGSMPIHIDQPPPMADPSDRPAAEVAAADTYHSGDKVWVLRTGRWRPGRVLEASARAVMVRYRPTEQAGTGVDTVTAECLAARVGNDRALDGPSDGISGAGRHGISMANARQPTIC